MAKRKAQPEVTETEPTDPVVDNTLPEPESGEEGGGEEGGEEGGGDGRPDETAEIAVDYGDGVYHIIKAPGGVTRALVTVVDGKHMQHVGEFEGRWAYREL